MAKPKDITGQRVGSLIAIEISEEETIKRNSASKIWKCQCDCQNVTYVSIGNWGKTQSCGCKTKANKNKTTLKNLKHNNYDLTGEFGVGFDNNNKEFYFDLEDYDKIKDYCWRVKYDNYVETNTRKLIEGTNKSLSLHRVIMNIEDKNIHIDHINHKPNDNRKKNLRVVTREQNQANAKIRVDNTSGIKGVYYCNTWCKWVASIQENKRKHSKSFETKEEAISYRKYLEEKYQKEYSYQKSIGEVINE